MTTASADPTAVPCNWRVVGAGLLIVALLVSACGWTALVYPIGIAAQVVESGTVDKSVFAAIHQGRRNTHVGYPATAGLVCGLAAAGLVLWARRWWWDRRGRWVCLAVVAGAATLVTVSAALWLWWLTIHVHTLPYPEG